MASLDDTSVLEKGTSLRVGSWIFVADGSGGFESRSTNQDPPEASEAAKCREFDEFIDQLEEIGFLNLSNEAWIQPEFNAIKAKTLSKLEEDLEKLLEDSKQETTTDGKTLPANCIRPAEPSPRKKKSKTSFKKTTRKRKQPKIPFQTLMISMKRSSTASRKLKTRSTSTLSTLQNCYKIKLSSNISKNWMNQSLKKN